MDIQQPATLAESRKAPTAVGSSDLLGGWLTTEMKTKRLRQLLAERDGTSCHWCNRPLRLAGKRHANDFATVDHLVRVIHGGKLTPENTVLACRKCNGGRHVLNWKPNQMFERVNPPNNALYKSREI